MAHTNKERDGQQRKRRKQENLRNDSSVINLTFMTTDSHHNEAEEWLTPKQVGDRLPGTPTPSTIRNWCKAGIITGAVRTPGGRWLIPVSAAERLEQSFNVETPGAGGPGQ